MYVRNSKFTTSTCINCFIVQATTESSNTCFYCTSEWTKICVNSIYICICSNSLFFDSITILSNFLLEQRRKNKNFIMVIKKYRFKLYLLNNKWTFCLNNDSCCICGSRVQTFCDPTCLLDSAGDRRFYCLMDGRNCFAEYHSKHQPNGSFPTHSTRGLCSICNTRYSRFSCSKCGKRICLLAQDSCFYLTAHLGVCCWTVWYLKIILICISKISRMFSIKNRKRFERTTLSIRLMKSWCCERIQITIHILT